jgi:hypothetical protein
MPPYGRPLSLRSFALSLSSERASSPFRKEDDDQTTVGSYTLHLTLSESAEEFQIKGATAMAITQSPMPAGSAASEVSVKQQSATPTRKVIAGGLAGAVTIIVVYVLNTYLLPKPLPAELVAPITVIVSFAISYLIPPSAVDQVTPA